MSGSMKPGRKTISIHALREEGDCELMRSNLISISISIHALREEGDCSAVQAS